MGEGNFFKKACVEIWQSTGNHGKSQKKKRGGLAPNKTNKKIFEKVFILLGAILGAIWSIMGPKYFKYFPMAKVLEPLPTLLVPSTIV